ncbi:MAG: SAM-dependent methyltransferase [Hydrogenibacillus schlegelii]|uniref:SAM-dependent methyltransferase n=1 Tax=Hydrogenibacillus schlegelii TaxID=1484 RepID=A0A2T5G5S9_HYDSH|nr:class I SAM-dependent methyltransferase [Hydrogenibacillus schlegelii]PTQ51544.1 MAG: SAM-dependent methyltransferase [Hydrogenibacillus schlegelii]
MPIPMTELAHRILDRALRPGDRAVDATAGSGRDTVFLAERVGPSGVVYAFDIQPEALERARRRLERRGLANVRWFMHDHAELPRFVPPGIAAAVFNLGFWPEGRPDLTTRTPTTLAAVKAALALLRPGGVLTVIAYPGHPEGAREAEALERFFAVLPHPAYHVYTFRRMNGPDRPGKDGTAPSPDSRGNGDPIAATGRLEGDGAVAASDRPETAGPTGSSERTARRSPILYAVQKSAVQKGGMHGADKHDTMGEENAGDLETRTSETLNSGREGMR